jgi:hypothetical protein
MAMLYTIFRLTAKLLQLLRLDIVRERGYTDDVTDSYARRQGGKEVFHD